MMVLSTVTNTVEHTELSSMLEPDRPLGPDSAEIDDDPGIMIGRVLIDPHGATFPVRCINTSKEPVVIDCAQILGDLEKVETIATLPTMDEDQSPEVNLAELANPEVDIIRHVLTKPENFKKIALPQLPENWEPPHGDLKLPDLPTTNREQKPS